MSSICLLEMSASCGRHNLPSTDSIPLRPLAVLAVGPYTARSHTFRSQRYARWLLKPCPGQLDPKAKEASCWFPLRGRPCIGSLELCASSAHRSVEDSRSAISLELLRTSPPISTQLPSPRGQSLAWHTTLCAPYRLRLSIILHHLEHATTASCKQPNLDQQCKRCHLRITNIPIRPQQPSRPQQFRPPQALQHPEPHNGRHRPRLRRLHPDARDRDQSPLRIRPVRLQVPARRLPRHHPPRRPAGFLLRFRRHRHSRRPLRRTVRSLLRSG